MRYKTLLTLTVLSLALCGCDDSYKVYDPTTEASPKMKERLKIKDAERKKIHGDAWTKKVIGKEAAIENRFSAVDVFFGNGSITKSQTVYYLIASDGSVTEVGMSDYSRTKIGDMYQSLGWHIK